jgi:RNA polymerase sigma factor (sigma-70 family)
MFLKLFSRSKPESDDDQALLRQYRETGNLDFIGVLFGRYTEMVYLVCYKYLQDEDDSKDAAMQIFENLAVSLQKHEINNFKSWLHVTAKNHCLMQLRSRKAHELKRNRVDAAGLGMQNDSPLHLAEEDSLNEDLLLLEKGLAHIPEEQRRCVDLFYLQQKCYKEIAEITGYDLNKVRSYIQNGRRNLKIYLERHHEDR